MRRHLVFGIALSLGLLLPQWAVAQSAQKNIDLSSGNAALPLKDFVSRDSLSITQNGAPMTLTGNQVLTSAELMAAMQVAQAGKQSLVLDGAGRAVGGSLQLYAAVSNQAASILIPHGVTAIRDVATQGALNLSGSLINYGTIYGISSSSAVTTALFSAHSIVNHTGALLSTILPPGGLPGTGSVLQSLNLSIAASHNILNNGVISSSANLSLSSPNIANAGTLTAASNLNIAAAQLLQNLAGAQMIAQQNLSISTADLINAGAITASSGKLSIENLLGRLSIENTSGEILAGLGKIEIGSLSDLLISGGKLTAGELFFESLQSTVGVDLDSIEGPSNFSGTCVSVAVKQGILDVRSLTATDDPLLVNNLSDVLLPAGLGAGPLTVIAAGSIIGAPSGTVISTGATDVILLAGAANSTSAGITTVTGPSGLQGDITNINAIAVDGANITIGSYQGGLTVKGGVSTVSGEGKIRIFVPGDMSFASLSNAGAHKAGNCIEIVCAAPDLGPGLTFSAGGALLTGEVKAGVPGNGSIQVGTINVDGTSGRGGDILIAAGNKLSTGPLYSSGLPGQSLGASGQDGGTLSLRAGAGGVVVNGNISMSGGSGVHGLDFTSQAGGNGGNGGSLDIVSGGDVFLKLITANGGGGAGGAGSGIGDLDAGKGGDGGSGGNISVDAGGRLLVGFINVSGGNGGGGGGGCCKGGRGGDGGTSGHSGSNGIQATATGELLGHFSYGDLHGGWYEGPGGGWPGYGGYGGGGGSGGWWGWVHGGEGGTGGSGGDVSLSADKGVQTSTIWSFGGGSGGGGGMVASGGGGASTANGGRSEDWIVQGDGPPGGKGGLYAGGGGGGGANHYFPGFNGDVYGGNGGDNSSGGPSGGGGAGGWGYGGKGGGWGPTGFGGDISLAASNGALDVVGDLQAFSFTKTAGSVNIEAGKDINVSGVIRTDSGTQSGSITLVSSEGSIGVNGRLDAYTHAYSPSGAILVSADQGSVRLGSKIPTVADTNLLVNTRTLGAPGGSISISAMDLISVNGSIGTGAAGNLLLSTAINSKGPSPVAYRTGLVLIAGTLSARSVDISAGSLRVLGGKGATSIAASYSGHILIHTYGTQPFPTYFDLASDKANTAALPGAVFSVGDSSVNGTAGNILGPAKATIANAAFITESNPLNLNDGGLIIQTSGSSFNIIQDGNPLQIAATDGAGKRTMVTPGQAAALYQVSRDSSIAAQTIVLNAKGQVVDGGTAEAPVPSQMVLPSSDLMLPFSRFTLSTAGTPLTLSLTGLRPALNLSSASFIDINGAFNFQDANAQATVLIGDKPLLVSETGKISASDTASITLLGSSKSLWKNFGEIEAGNIIFKGTDKGLLSLSMGSTGSLSSPGANPGFLQVSTYDFLLSGGQIDNMIFSVSPAGKTVNSVTFSSTLGPTSIFGSLVANTIKISSTGDFTVRAVDQLSASNVLQMQTGGNLYILGQVSGKDITLSPKSDLIISSGAQISSTTKTTVLGKNVTVGGALTSPNIKFANAGDLTIQSTGYINGSKSLTISNSGSVDQSGSVSGFTVLINPKGAINLQPGSQTSANTKGSLSLRPAGALTVGGNLSAPSLVLKPGTDLTIDSSASISTAVFPTLNPVGNLTVNAQIQAKLLNFSSGKQMTIGPAATLAGSSSVTLSSAGDMHIAGIVSAPTISLRSTKAALFLENAAQLNSTGKVTLSSAQQISIGNAALINANAGMTFTNNGTGANAGILIAEQASLNSNSGFITINSSFPVSIAHGAHLSSGTALAIKSAQNLQVSDAVTLSSALSTVNLNGKTGLSISDAADISAAKGLLLQSAANLSLGRDAQITNASGSIVIASENGTVSIGKNASIQSGILVPWLNHPGRFGVSKSGGIQVLSGSKQAGAAGISIDSGAASGDQSLLRSAGGKLSLVTTGGADIVIGDNAHLESNGANLHILSSGNVLGGTGDTIVSNVAVNLTSLVFAGGGIDIAAGKSTPTSAVNPPLFQVTPQSPPIGTVNITNDPASKGGLVKVEISGAASINLSSGGTASSIDITGAVEKQGFGYLNLTAKGDGKSIQFDGAGFSSGKPIGFIQSTDDGGNASDSDDDSLRPIAWTAAGTALRLPPNRIDGWKSLQLPNAANPSARIFASSLPSIYSRANDFVFKSGSMLIWASANTNLHVPGALLKLKPGAVAVVDVHSEYCAIKCLSGPGHLKLLVDANSFDLAPGEEIGLASKQGSPSLSSIAQDGIARRRVQINKLGARSYWSADASLMSLLEKHHDLQTVRAGKDEDARKLRQNILKTAAALQILGGKYGNYTPY